MELFDAVGKWFWLLCILVTLANGAIFKFRAKKRIEQNPDLEDGYRRIIKGFVSWGNLPWIVMGIGCTFGGIPSVWHYFNPRAGNPYVLAFFGSILLIWLLGTRWIFFQGGAEALVKHPGIFNHDIKSPLMIKFFWMVCLLGGVIGFIMMFTQEISAPIG